MPYVPDENMTASGTPNQLQVQQNPMAPAPQAAAPTPATAEGMAPQVAAAQQSVQQPQVQQPSVQRPPIQPFRLSGNPFAPQLAQSVPSLEEMQSGMEPKLGSFYKRTAHEMMAMKRKRRAKGRGKTKRANQIPGSDEMSKNIAKYAGAMLSARAASPSIPSVMPILAAMAKMGQAAGAASPKGLLSPLAQTANASIPMVASTKQAAGGVLKLFGMERSGAGMGSKKPKIAPKWYREGEDAYLDKSELYYGSGKRNRHKAAAAPGIGHYLAAIAKSPLTGGLGTAGLVGDAALGGAFAPKGHRVEGAGRGIGYGTGMSVGGGIGGLAGLAAYAAAKKIPLLKLLGQYGLKLGPSSSRFGGAVNTARRGSKAVAPVGASLSSLGGGLAGSVGGGAAAHSLMGDPSWKKQSHFGPNGAPPPAPAQPGAPAGAPPSTDAINQSYDTGKIDAKEWMRQRQQLEEGGNPPAVPPAPAGAPPSPAQASFAQRRPPAAMGGSAYPPAAPAPAPAAPAPAGAPPPAAGAPTSRLDQIRAQFAEARAPAQAAGGIATPAAPNNPQVARAAAGANRAIDTYHRNSLLRGAGQEPAPLHYSSQASRFGGPTPGGAPSPGVARQLAINANMPQARPKAPMGEAPAQLTPEQISAHEQQQSQMAQSIGARNQAFAANRTPTPPGEAARLNAIAAANGHGPVSTGGFGGPQVAGRPQRGMGRQQQTGMPQMGMGRRGMGRPIMKQGNLRALLLRAFQPGKLNQANGIMDKLERAFNQSTRVESRLASRALHPEQAELLGGLTTKSNTALGRLLKFQASGLARSPVKDVHKGVLPSFGKQSNELAGLLGTGLALGAGGGAAIGSAVAGPGRRMAGAGRGVGAGVGGALGGIGGGLAGLLGGMALEDKAPLLARLLPTIGGFTGMHFGARGGHQLAGKLMKDDGEDELYGDKYASADRSLTKEAIIGQLAKLMARGGGKMMSGAGGLLSRMGSGLEQMGGAASKAVGGAMSKAQMAGPNGPWAKPFMTPPPAVPMRQAAPAMGRQMASAPAGMSKAQLAGPQGPYAKPFMTPPPAPPARWAQPQPQHYKNFQQGQMSQAGGASTAAVRQDPTMAATQAWSPMENIMGKAGSAELTPFAKAFVERCLEHNMTNNQIKLAMLKAGKVHPDIAKELQPLVKEAVLPWLLKGLSAAKGIGGAARAGFGAARAGNAGMSATKGLTGAAMRGGELAGKATTYVPHGLGQMARGSGTGYVLGEGVDQMGEAVGIDTGGWGGTIGALAGGGLRSPMARRLAAQGADKGVGAVSHLNPFGPAAGAAAKAPTGALGKAQQFFTGGGMANPALAGSRLGTAQKAVAYGGLGATALNARDGMMRNGFDNALEDQAKQMGFDSADHMTQVAQMMNSGDYGGLMGHYWDRMPGSQKMMLGGGAAMLGGGLLAGGMGHGGVGAAMGAGGLGLMGAGAFGNRMGLFGGGQGQGGVGGGRGQQSPIDSMNPNGNGTGNPGNGYGMDFEPRNELLAQQ